MSLFGVQQAENLVTDSTRPASKTEDAFDSITQVAQEELDGVVKDVFNAGDRLQSGAINVLFGATRRGTSEASAKSPRSSLIANVNSGRLNTSTFIVLGEGLAAGMGDFTLSYEAQVESFPAQMARQMGTTFLQPLIQPPGICSPVGFAQLPVIVPMPMQTTVLDKLPPAPVNNLSVPGYRLHDALYRRASQPLIQRDNATQTAANLIFGAIPIAYGHSRQLATQLECAVNRKPGFTLVELGYYEALEAAVAGDPSRLPDVASFRSNYAKLLKALKQSGSEVLVLTLPDPFDTAHFLSLDEAANILKLETDFLLREYGFSPQDIITANGLNEIGFQLFGKSIEKLPRGRVNAQVAREIRCRLRTLNQELISIAKSCDAHVYDLQAFFGRIKSEGIVVGSKKLTAEYLGGFYSLNGYYPGPTGHALIANELLQRLNDIYESDFPQIDVSMVMRGDPVAAYEPAKGPVWKGNQLGQIRSEFTASPIGVAANVSGLSKAISRQGARGWEELGQSRGSARAGLQLPPGLEQVLPLSKSASYFGDGIAALNCRDPQAIQWGSCGPLLFGGLALVDSHLKGDLRITFTRPRNNLTHFEISFPDGLVGDDAVLVTPQFFKMAFQHSRVDGVPGMVSSGTLNLETGEVLPDLKVYARYSSTALLALVSVNPTFPRQPLSFPGPYGSAWARFEQRSDGLLDFAFYGSTYVPLGKNIRWPLNFFSATWQFATVPADGTVMHPHLHLSTKEPEGSDGDGCDDLPLNTIEELTLFTHNSSFGDAFSLSSPELGGKATGRSHVLGRAMLQFGGRCGNSVPVAVSFLNPGGYMAETEPSPITQVFPGRLYPGPHGFDEFMRFPLRTYSLDDLAILDDPFDISMGAVDLQTGRFLNELLHRGFINQDLIFALLRIEPRTPKDSFFFRGPAALERDSNGRLSFRFKGEVHIPYPEGFLFPTPNLTTGIVIGSNSALDPFLWIHAIQDEDAEHLIMEGGARDVISSTAERFSYHYKIAADPNRRPTAFEYENHTQRGKFRMHSLAWVGFSDSRPQQRSGKPDTVTFTGFGIWCKDGSETVQQATVQVCTSPQKPYVGIQIDAGNVSNVNTKPVNIEDAVP
jgi:hypothetical protein